MDHGFQGLDGQTMPDMPEEFIASVTARYIELFEQLTGTAFQKGDISNMERRIEENVNKALKALS
jgi:phosphoribosylaminoimidazole-succinocarboxamide synthase